MFVVLISARYQRILEWIEQCSQINSLSYVKRIGPKIFLYVDTDLTYNELVSLFKKTIHQNGGGAYVYQFYTLYNGMIDYNDYLPERRKQEMDYYQKPNKDLSQEEIRCFLKK